MTERLDWFPCNPGKLLGALAQMRAPEGYVYVVVLLRIYEVGGPCRDSLSALATRTKLSKRVVTEALDSLVQAGKLVRDVGGIHNPYAVEVLATQKARRENAKSSGQKGAFVRHRKMPENQRNGPSDPKATPVAKPGYLESEVEKERKVKTDSPAPAGGLFDSGATTVDDWPKDFREQFWRAYPRRTAKAAAMSKLEAMRRHRRVTWAVLIAGVERYARHVAVHSTEQRFVKHPATWLNQGCWDDELDMTPESGPPRGPRPTMNGMAALAARSMMEGSRERDDGASEHGEGGGPVSAFGTGDGDEDCR